MTKKWNLVIDIDRCNGCYNCALAAKDEYVGNDEPGYFAPQPRHGQAWIDVRQRERGQYPALDVAYVPVMCNHCDDAPCIAAAQDGAVRKRPDGIVIIDPEKAKGQKAIVDACPYGAVHWNEALETPQHWPFDAHLLDRGWSAPRCVEVCATGAISALKIEDGEMQRIAQEKKLSVRHPELGTRPRVYYKNLERSQSEFIAGSVIVKNGSAVDCAADAVVELRAADGGLATATTDAFGDFRFGGLSADTGPYFITVRQGQLAASAEVARLAESTYVGKLLLT